MSSRKNKKRDKQNLIKLSIILAVLEIMKTLLDIIVSIAKDTGLLK